MVTTGAFARFGALALHAARAFGGAVLRMPRVVCVAAALAWMALHAWLSSSSFAPPGTSMGGSYVTNLGHGPLFGVLAILVIGTLPRRREPFPWVRLGARECAFVLAVALGWGLFDEWLQSRQAARHASVLDVVTDVVATAAVLLVAREAGERGARPERMTRLVALGLALVLGAALVATLADHHTLAMRQASMP